MRKTTKLIILMFNTFGLAWPLPHYPLAISNFIGCKPLFVLTKLLFWVVRCVVNCKPMFRTNVPLSSSGFDSMNWHTLVIFIKMSGRNNTWHYNPEDTVPEKSGVKLSNHCFPVVKNVFASGCILLVHDWFCMEEITPRNPWQWRGW